MMASLLLALRNTSDPRVAGAFFFGVPKVEHGRATRHITGGSIIGADHAIPEKVGDAVVAGFVVIMVEQVQLLDSTQEPTPRRIVQMLDAMTEFIKQGADQGRAHGRSGARRPTDEETDRQGHDGNRRQRRIHCPEQHPQISGIRVMVIVDALPQRSRERSAVQETPV